MSPTRIDVNEHVYLSDFARTDAPALVRFLNDKQIYENTLRIPYPYTPSDAENFLGMNGAHANQHAPIHYAIRGQDDQLMGACGFDDLVLGHSAEIGYWLARPYRGQGIMTAVVRAACHFAQTKWELARIWAYVFDSNLASARVLEKAGFAYEGLLRKHRRKDNQFINSKLYALVT